MRWHFFGDMVAVLVGIEGAIPWIQPQTICLLIRDKQAITSASGQEAASNAMIFLGPDFPLPSGLLGYVPPCIYSQQDKEGQVQLCTEAATI